MERSIEAAKAIARRYGVNIPEDVKFVRDKNLTGTLKGRFAEEGNHTAQVAGLTEDAEGYVHWKDLYAGDTKIPIRINPEVLKSDEAVVAVFTHELYEIEQLRELFREAGGRMQGYDFFAHVKAFERGNLHDLAWDAADKAVYRMRKTLREGGK